MRQPSAGTERLDVVSKSSRLPTVLTWAWQIIYCDDSRYDKIKKDKNGKWAYDKGKPPRPETDAGSRSDCQQRAKSIEA